MSRVINWMRSTQIGRILTAFLGGILLFISTACSNTPNVLAKTADQIREEVPEGAVTSRYKGGMNDYSDVDPRTDTKAAQAKAKALVDNAEGNLQKRADNPDQYGRNYQEGTPLGERVRRLGEDVGSSADEVREGVAKGTQRGVENLKENTQNAAEDTKRAAQNVKENANEAGKNVAEGTKRAAQNVKDTAENTADAVKSKVKQDVSSTKQALDKAADAID